VLPVAELAGRAEDLCGEVGHRGAV
jgi:hypothetical protein